MKKVQSLFIFSFILYFIGHLLWTINIRYNHQLIEEWIINIPFSMFSIIILYTCIIWYKQK